MLGTKSRQRNQGVIEDLAQFGKVQFASYGGVGQTADDQALLAETAAGVGPLRLQSPYPLGFQPLQNSGMNFCHGSPRPNTGEEAGDLLAQRVRLAGQHLRRRKHLARRCSGLGRRPGYAGDIGRDFLRPNNEAC